MKLPIKDIAIAAVVFVLAAGVIGTMSNKYDDIQEAADATTTNTGEFRKLFRANFMEGCNPNGETTTYCQCLWADLSSNSTDAELLAMDDEANAGGIPDKLVQSANKCNGSI